MANDYERREVAERLRAYGKEFGDPTWRELCNVVFGGDNRYPTTVRKLHLVDRIADLIDPGDTSLSCRDTVACDREALLALADEMDAYSGHFSTGLQGCAVQSWAMAIREACGEAVG